MIRLQLFQTVFQQKPDLPLKTSLPYRAFVQVSSSSVGRKSLQDPARASPSTGAAVPSLDLPAGEAPQTFLGRAIRAHASRLRHR